MKRKIIYVKIEHQQRCRYLAILSHVLTVAVKEWGWLAYNPMQHITKLKEPPGRVRFLSDKERNALFDACRQEEKKPLYLIVLLAISTGARKGEILNCKWNDVDFNRQVITIHETKNNESRSLFLFDQSLELLKQYADSLKKHEGFVFRNKGKQTHICIEREWKRVIKRARLTNFRFHDYGILLPLILP